MKANKVQTSSPELARAIFNEMSREQLREIATHYNVKRGKGKSDTIKNLVAAVGTHQIQVKAIVTLSFKPADNSASRVTSYGETLRTYTSGPGEGNVIWRTTSQAAAGHPTDPAGI